MENEKKILDEINDAILQLKALRRIAIMPIEPQKPVKSAFDFHEKPKFFTTGFILKLIFFGLLFYFPVLLAVSYFTYSNNYLIALVIISSLGFVLRYISYKSDLGRYKKNLPKFEKYNIDLKLYEEKMIKFNGDIKEYHSLVNLNKDIDNKIELLKIEGKRMIAHITKNNKLSQTKLLIEYLNFSDENQNIGFVNRPFDENEFSSKISVDLGIKFIRSLSKTKQEELYNLLIKVNEIQNSDLSNKTKVIAIRDILWTKQSVLNKLMIGGFLGTIFGLIAFGTGGIGIAAFGGAIGIWGFLAGTAGGILISSLIANFEKSNHP